ncbi:hypothetical protein [Urechidicola vernalis]|uniref:Uncharacterized protein n=1 Tax=Urechidicola vernalis TaxID=3075600 RepID=A0ABU2Y3X9_9FLAO|nr:hypothetical protein [Urechidicola sp. P050]MDT0551743.1 hypothetical protein [Urechidicola sp. P050]
MSPNYIVINRYTSILNHRTIIAMVMAIATTFFAFELNIHFNIDITLISIAIIFPLVFTIRGSFRRREKALEHLSQFRSALKTLNYLVKENNSLNEEEKTRIINVLQEISDETIKHLKRSSYDTSQLDETLHKVTIFINGRAEVISERFRSKIFRFMSDLHEAVDNLHAIHVHRTPISLKAYCKIFIYIFPLIYAPIIIDNVGLDKSQWIVYFIVLVTEYILISLYNIQDQLEYPFDDNGLDDIKLDIFRLNR